MGTDLSASYIVLLLSIGIVRSVGVVLDRSVNDVLDIGTQQQRCHSHWPHSLHSDDCKRQF